MQKTNLTELPPLALKPGKDEPAEVYSFYEKELGGFVTFRSLDLSFDLDMIYDWVNRAYSRRFWQLNGSKELVCKTYEAVLENPRSHSFIGSLYNQPFCQIDVYGVLAEELEQHTVARSFDCGLHLLMLPTKQSGRGWSYYALKNFQRFYFTCSVHEELFAEPDQENILANKLAMDSGFRFIKTIALSNKTANLYSITRQQFSK